MSYRSNTLIGRRAAVAVLALASLTAGWAHAQDKTTIEVAAYQSAEVREFIETKFKGSLIPAF